MREKLSLLNRSITVKISFSVLILKWVRVTLLNATQHVIY
jgi:hypothetical protein